MKKLVYVSVLSILFFAACHKQQETFVPDAGYLSVVEKYVRQHPRMAEYDSVDFARYRVSKQEKTWYLRLPFKNKAIASDFILLQTDNLGNTSDGKIIHLDKSDGAAGNFNGAIEIMSLDRKEIMHSAIRNGFIELWHPNLFATNTKETIVPGPYDELPEVIVVGHSPSVNTGISVADYIMLQSMFGGGSSSGGNNDGYGSPANGTANSGSTAIYSPIDYGTSSNAGGDPNANTPSSPVDVDIPFSFDESFFRPAIDVNAWLKCFTDIPDAGATSSITLLGDLPVSSDPTMGLNIWNGNTGHCFLQISKTNGAQSVTQIMGFTAQSAAKAIVNTDAFVPSKMVDNAGHKYNCSITVPLSAAGLNTVISSIQLLADMPYSVVRYDCLDFGLDIINSVRIHPLLISKQYVTDQPFSNIANGPKLYELLQSMVQSGSPETPNIILGDSRHAGVSHGPCN